MEKAILKKWTWTGTNKEPNKKKFLFDEKGNVILSVRDGVTPNAKYAEIIAEAESVRQERDAMLALLSVHGINWKEACNALFHK